MCLESLPASPHHCGGSSLYPTSLGCSGPLKGPWPALAPCPEPDRHSQLLHHGGDVSVLGSLGSRCRWRSLNPLFPQGAAVEAYEAAMVLSGVGDALGYRAGRWEYCTSGPQIHAELAQLGGWQPSPQPPEWPVSDDTVLHLATAEGLATGPKDLGERQGGSGNLIPPVLPGTSQLRPGEPEGYRIPFNPSGTGCGAAMRSLAIGLRYPHAWELPTLIRVSIESGRMTHHHPTGYLGALAVALFGALGIRGEPSERWGAELLRVLPLAWDYVESTKVAVEDNAAAWPFFGEAWYLDSRGLLDGRGPPQVPSLPSPAERDTEYLGWALDGWAGRSGHDAPMVALEALLAAGGCWEDLCARAVLHGGDSDSTGTIAAGCWGLQHGLTSIPPGLHCHLEYRKRLRDAAHQLHALAWGGR
uniref:ADP-ribosylarginine hydrolase n=1 Tax=Malurus cyaneus samueli TaxID=2593467 RepID=A0A8C5TLR8_9PASS